VLLPVRMLHAFFVAAKFGVPLDLSGRQYLNGGQVVLEVGLPAFGAGDGGIRDHANAVAAPSRSNCAAAVLAQRVPEQWMPRIRG